MSAQCWVFVVILLLTFEIFHRIKFCWIRLLPRLPIFIVKNEVKEIRKENERTNELRFEYWTIRLHLDIFIQISDFTDFSQTMRDLTKNKYQTDAAKMQNVPHLIWTAYWNRANNDNETRENKKKKKENEINNNIFISTTHSRQIRFKYGRLIDWNINQTNKNNKEKKISKKWKKERRKNENLYRFPFHFRLVRIYPTDMTWMKRNDLIRNFRFKIYVNIDFDFDFAKYIIKDMAVNTSIVNWFNSFCAERKINC